MSFNKNERKNETNINIPREIERWKSWTNREAQTEINEGGTKQISTRRKIETLTEREKERKKMKEFRTYWNKNIAQRERKKIGRNKYSSRW